MCLSILDDYIPCWGESPLAKDQGWSYGYSVPSILVQTTHMAKSSPNESISLHTANLTVQPCSCIYLYHLTTTLN